MENSADNFPAYTNQTDAYRAHLPSQNYTWGSNRTKANMANLAAAYKEYGLNVNNNNLAEEISGSYLHYLHGCNPTGKCFLSNMQKMGASFSVNTMYHGWFTDGHPDWDDVRTSTYGPAPGFLTGGVNPSYSLDGCCASNTCGTQNSLCQNLQPPLQQPVQKSYLDWNTGWPQNSWQIPEPAIYYQSAYLMALANKVDFSQETIENMIPVKQVTGEINIEPQPYSVLLKSINGLIYKITINNSGNITTVPVTNLPASRAEIAEGNLFIVENQKGILMNAPDQTTWRVFANPQGEPATEMVTVLPGIRSEISDADMYVSQPGQGIIFKDRDNQCYKLFVHESGQLIMNVCTCPMD